jgi:hypothetical protein
MLIEYTSLNQTGRGVLIRTSAETMHDNLCPMNSPIETRLVEHDMKFEQSINTDF